MSQAIIITGFMGSGKTTVALALARTLNCRAIDLDQLITERAGRTPKEIIDQDGESTFREIETRLLLEVLEQDSARVIELGGGAWTLPGYRYIITYYECFTCLIDDHMDVCM